MKEIKKKYYFLYKTTNLVNNKIYIGIHGTNNLDDGYLGSGYILRKAIKKYGRKNFKREILINADSYESLAKIEREIVNEDFVKKRNTYNRELGGAGGKIWTIEERKKMSISQIGHKSWNKGIPHTKETREKMKLNHADFSGEKNPMYGKPSYYKMTKEEKENWKDNIGKGNIGKIRTEEAKNRYSKAASKRMWFKNKKTGKISHTINKNDFKINHPDWERMGKK